MKSILEQALNLLSSQQKSKGAGIVLLLVISSLLDFLSLAFFLPLILVLLQPELIQKNQILHELYESFNFLSVSAFSIALTVGVFIFIVTKTLVTRWITFRKASYAYAVGSEVAMRTIESYLARTYLEFSQADFSKEVNRMVSAPLAFSNNIIIPAGTLLSEAVVFLMIICAIAIFDFRAFVLVGLTLAPAALVYWLRKKHSSEISAKLGTYYPRVLKNGFEIAEGQVDIRSYQKEQYFAQKFHLAHQELDKVLATEHTAQTGTARITEIVGATAICAVIIYAILRGIASKEIIVMLGVYAAASFRIIPSVNRILSSLHHIRTNWHVVEALSLSKPVSAQESTHLSFQNNIIMEGISFQYPGQPGLIDGVILEIKRGEKIAITGPSGKGKTTILLLLLGYLPPNSGRVMIDGKTLDRRSEGSWRKLVGHVPQKPYVLDGTIASNIAFGEIFPDPVRIAALTKDLELDEWISTLPMGVQTHIGERGVKISGGQLQRISLARALYRNPEILLLDEVTNQLDPATESGIFKSLMKVCAGKTLIMITHNHEVLAQFDRVLKVNDGRLTETPTAIHPVK